MAFGITDGGYVAKTLDEILAELELSAKAKYGDSVNLQPDEFLGGLFAIMSERFALLWEGQEDVYNSQYPETSDGVNLQNVVTITGITVKGKTRSTVTVNCKGTLGTVLAAGQVASVLNEAATRFRSTELATIGAGTDEVQTITFSGVPTSGQFTLIFDGEETASIAWNDNAAAIQLALNNLIALSGVTVAGSYAAGFVVTFAGADGLQPQVDLTEAPGNTLDDGGAVSITITETILGLLPNIDVPYEGESVGPLAANAVTLTVIETPVAGWDSCTNTLDAEIGNDDETDAQLRTRRQASLAFPGSGTEEAIRSKLLQVEDVVSATVFSNRTNVIDGAGRPPKSFEAVVLGGTDNDIADSIWANMPIGIEPFGSTTVIIVDSQGFNQTIKFSRPTPVRIYVKATLVKGADYPVGGDEAVKENIVEYGQLNFSVGDDVILNELYTPINLVEGVIGITLLVDTITPPVGAVNLPIADNQISTWQVIDITIP